MILIDYSQVFIANLYQSLGKYLNSEINEDMIRHMVLNSLRSYRKKFYSEYGELVICCDEGSSWRREVFPYYKANRKKSRDESELDWNLIFTVLKKIRTELEELFPYRVIHVKSAEADDIISTLCMTYGKELVSPGTEKILILSADKDFIQLQKYANVEQYDPTRKRWINHNDPNTYRIEHIIHGDASDGVPNILSQDDSFVEKVRQKRITAKRLEEFTRRIRENDIDPTWEKNYNRNVQTIDLMNVPENIQNLILNKYEQQAGKGRENLFNYFFQHKLKNLTEVMNDF